LNSQKKIGKTVSYWALNNIRVGAEPKETNMVEFFVEEEVEDAAAPKGDEPGGDDVLQDEEALIAAEEAAESGTPDKIEELAGEIGWRPDGDLSAKDFILKSRDIQDTMRTHIQDQKKQLSELGSSVAELKIHNERVYKAEVSRLKGELDTLKKEKRLAIEDGDADKVDELDEQIDGLKEAMAAPKPEVKSGDNAAFDTWIVNNSWYDNDPEMAKYADAIADQNPGAPYERVLSLAERKVKEMFPDRFEGEAAVTTPGSLKSKTKPAASPVESGGRRAAGATFTKADLSSDQLNIMSQFVRQGIMTEKQYIADISKTQGA